MKNSSALDRFVSLLDLPDSDYWFDVGSSEARAFIDVSPQSLLQEVALAWRTWAVHTQEHLAYILGEGTSETELEILREMEKSSSTDVAMRACEVLRSLRRYDA
jgi:hypothetical protein